jgi:hypothetical protein
MSQTNSYFIRRVNYDRVCTECGFHALHPKHGWDMCSRPVNLISGNPSPIRCTSARAVNGVCGPEGRHYSAESAVRKEAAE